MVGAARLAGGGDIATGDGDIGRAYRRHSRTDGFTAVPSASATVECRQMFRAQRGSDTTTTVAVVGQDTGLGTTDNCRVRPSALSDWIDNGEIAGLPCAAVTVILDG